MKNIYFDLCSIPIYCVILWTCYSKKLTKGNANRIFIAFSAISLFCAIADIWMEFVVNPLPLTQTEVALATVISFTYKLLRNSCILIYLLYILSITKTQYRIRARACRIALFLPFVILVFFLLQNFFTHNVFVVTAENGYSRGPMLIILYIVTALYGFVGTAYCIQCRRYLPAGKWLALLSVYILTFASVLIEFLRPSLLVEMFFTSIGMLMILLMVMRPEESLDASVNIASWKAYQDDLQNILRAKQSAQIVVIQLANAGEIRTLLGESECNNYISLLGDELHRLIRARHISADVYFERPATLYILTDDIDADIPGLLIAYEAAVQIRAKTYIDKGIRSSPRICIIKCPLDLSEYTDIISLGHMFTLLGAQDQIIFRASELKKSRDYDVTNHIEEILNRIITSDSLEMYYQPIYDIQAQCFRSAEALARVNDPVYGRVSPAVFIPAAEATGLILPIGEAILEAVYKFISEHDLQGLGISYIEINLSVAQCLQREFPQIVKRLQEKYHVDPCQVNFEVTETLLGNLNTIMERTVHELVEMGYTFSLDDYGVGYSNIQRLRTLPLRIIKIDKTLVDDMFTDDGKSIIENTVHMMKSIRKKLVFEGVETREAASLCGELSCDYIQGFYYSKPLPSEEFVKFIKEHNIKAS